MPHEFLRRFGRSAAATVVLAGCVTGLAHAGVTEFKIGEDYEVQVDGAPVEGAKVFEQNKGWGLLLDIPSEAMLFMIDTDVKTAFAVRRENVKFEKKGATASVKELFAWYVPVTSVGHRMLELSFHNGASEVLLVRKEPKPRESAPKPEGQVAGAGIPAPGAPSAPAGGTPTVESVPVAAPATSGRRTAAGPAKPAAPAGPASNAPPARDCVSLQSRPATGIPGCTSSVYIRNRCDAPVLAVVQRTEHLMTGTLPQTFDVTVPPGEQWIGCSWWNGAMAPADHEIAGAAYLDPISSR
jgi:hypothetical protein